MPTESNDPNIRRLSDEIEKACNQHLGSRPKVDRVEDVTLVLMLVAARLWRRHVDEAGQLNHTAFKVMADRSFEIEWRPTKDDRGSGPE